MATRVRAAIEVTDARPVQTPVQTSFLAVRTVPSAPSAASYVSRPLKQAGGQDLSRPVGACFEIAERHRVLVLGVRPPAREFAVDEEEFETLAALVEVHRRAGGFEDVLEGGLHRHFREASLLIGLQTACLTARFRQLHAVEGVVEGAVRRGLGVVTPRRSHAAVQERRERSKRIRGDVAVTICRHVAVVTLSLEPLVLLLSVPFGGLVGDLRVTKRRPDALAVQVRKRRLFGKQLAAEKVLVSRPAEGSARDEL